jgi:hypothetical protein
LPRLARKNGKVLAQVAYYTSAKAKGPFHVVFPRQTRQQHLPKTAEKVKVNFFESGTLKGIKTKTWVKPSTAKKMELIWW